MRAEPDSLVLLGEQATSFALDWHFVYHRSPKGHAADLADLLAISLRGGIGYQDGRASYAAAIGDTRGETMLFRKHRALVAGFLGMAAEQINHEMRDRWNRSHNRRL